MLQMLVLFTGLSGSAVWVRPDHVTVVSSPSLGVCSSSAATEIDLDSGKFVCVMESVDAVVSVLGRTP